MPYSVREARSGDLNTLVAFTLAEANEAERRAVDIEVVQRGVRAGLDDPSIATYWVLEDDAGQVVGSVSIVREWSDWHARDYWWIQSMYIRPEDRGKRLMRSE